MLVNLVDLGASSPLPVKRDISIMAELFKQTFIMNGCEKMPFGEIRKVGSIMIPNMMQAVVCHGIEDYRLEDVPTPSPGPGDVLVKVEACGVCAGDVKAYQGAPMFWGGGIQEPYVETPVIPGHEFVGVVAALGEGAGELHGFQVGERVVSEQIVPCGQCRFCQRGQYWMCQVHNIYGFQQSVNGGMAEYMIFPARGRHHKVSKDISLEAAAMIEPLACSIHAVNRAQIELGDTVVVAGAGPLGLGMIAVARMKNPGCLIALDLRDDRLQLAKDFGADIIMNPDNDDVVAAVLQQTDGYGCDVYIEATGDPSGVTQGLQMIRKLGRFVEFSVFTDPTTVDWSIIGDRKELDIFGAHLSPYTYPLAIEYAQSGQIPIGEAVTHKFPLAEFAAAFQKAKERDHTVKVLLIP